jgi:microsomal prostaglandin-E synthase 2
MPCLSLYVAACSESWGTFSYMTQQSHWNWAVQHSVRLAGAVLMWKVGQGMPKKYNIQGDLREALYADANSFVAAVGSQKFLGGEQPNLADLAVFGVLQAIRGTDTYNDVVMHSEIGPWLSRMVQVVGESSEVKQVPGKEGSATAAA